MFFAEFSWNEMTRAFWVQSNQKRCLNDEEGKREPAGPPAPTDGAEAEG